MKAILLAGGMGTRLRPLTLHTPKPVMPIFNRPFLYHQLDLLRQIPDIDEVVLSLNYQPHRIEEVFGDGRSTGIKISYKIEPEPLGTAGAIKFAAPTIDDTILVFNGDVLTQIDLGDVIQRHRDRGALATIVLTPVEDPSAYGVVETDDSGSVQRFVEKPKPGESPSNAINAGIYVLEPKTFDRIPDGVPWSIERSYFPSLVERGEPFVAYRYDGYWIDIGTPAKYLQVHHDIMSGRFAAKPFINEGPRFKWLGPGACISDRAQVDGPCFIDEGVVVEAGARVLPNSVIGRHCAIGAGATVDGAILWRDTRVAPRAIIRGAILGRGCTVEEGASIEPGAVFGDGARVWKT